MGNLSGYMQTDMNITTLELADNHLLAEGAKYLVEMLRANFTIQNLVRVGLCIFVICQTYYNIPYQPLSIRRNLKVKSVVDSFRISPRTTFNQPELSALQNSYWKTFQSNP